MLPVVFSTDENNAKPAMVAISSVIERSQLSPLRIVVLVPEAFDASCASEMARLASGGSASADIELIRIPDSLLNDYSREPDRITGASHISRAGWFRLLLPSLLPEADRCLYLDTDTVTVSDLSELDGFDLGSNLLAGVVAASFSQAKDREDRARKIGIGGYETFVNSGVLLMNLELMRREGAQQAMVDLVAKGLYDQDILNIACYGRVSKLDVGYNLTSSYFRLFGDKLYVSNRLILKEYPWEDLRRACAQPFIVHYVGPRKPWNTPNRMFGFRWLASAAKVFGSPQCEFPCQDEHSCELAEDTVSSRATAFAVRALSKVFGR